MESKRKILFFVPLPPPITGAALRNQSLVESKLLQSSFNIKVIPFNFVERVEDIGKFSIWKVWKFIHRFFLIFYSVLSFRPHLVYFNLALYGHALYRDTVYVGLFKMLGCRLLYHLRTQGVRKQAEHSAFKRALFRFVFRNTQIICLSKNLSKDIEAVFSGTPMVVNNGIPDVSSRYPVNGSSQASHVRILYVGHLWKFKGIIELIRSLGALKTEGLLFKASIVGPEGDLRIADLLRLIADLGLTEDIAVTGTLEGDPKFQMFREADIFVLPTHWEAFPGVILEAMQFSLPVVATREGAIPEIVDDRETGLLISKEDETDLADKLRTLMKDPTLRVSMGLKGRKKFEEHYDVRFFEANMKEAFLTALPKP